jgi:hypothetical protein
MLGITRIVVGGDQKGASLQNLPLETLVSAPRARRGSVRVILQLAGQAGIFADRAALPGRLRRRTTSCAAGFV